jgi:hypothetical protein
MGCFIQGCASGNTYCTWRDGCSGPILRGEFRYFDCCPSTCYKPGTGFRLCARDWQNDKVIEGLTAAADPTCPGGNEYVCCRR